ncbi:hypothetical protein GGX14DRAFT_507843 [Mycena pura]|uniref:Uncharacterized protein n=1 Tax=Mycena pura TaxID=153505 RepID=A0AAD6YU24_9AGAR|nr:hypothetical protein GGX14DRAFT_507843 [Mycena pura]
MKVTIFAAILFVTPLVNALPPVPPNLVGRSFTHLETRSCPPSACGCNGVTGPPGPDSGLFCGNSAINPACITGEVFQCNESGSTCAFGPRDTCTQCNALHC